MFELTRWLVGVGLASSVFAGVSVPVDLTSTLEEVRPALKAKEPADRIAALRKIAAVNQEGPGPPSPEIARALAVGLNDEEFEVRTETVVLLVDHQDAEAALVLLLKTVKRAEDDVKAWGEKASRVISRIFDEDGPPTQGGEVGRAFAAQQLLQVTVAALGRIPDDRAEDALVSLTRRAPSKLPSRLCEPICGALLELRTRRGMECVLDVLAEYEHVSRRQTEDGVKRQSERILSSLAKSLSSCAAAVGTLEPTGTEGSLSSRWKKWFTANRDLFRPSPGRTSGTVELNLRPQLDALRARKGK